MVFVIFVANTQAQSKFFDKLAANDNVTAVYISKALLDMVPQLDTGADGPDLKQLANKLDQIEIYSCDDDAKTIAMMRSEIDAFSKNRNLESFMRIKDKGQKVNFYGVKENSFFKDLIMTVDKDNSTTVIRIEGKFTSKDIENVVKTVNK